MLARRFGQRQSPAAKFWWPRPGWQRCVRTAETSCQPSPFGSYRRTWRTAATESSASPSCRMVTVVGPPPSGEASATVEMRAAWISPALMWVSASSVGDCWPGFEGCAVEAALRVDPQPVKRRSARASDSPRRRSRRRLRGGTGFARASAKPESTGNSTVRGPNGHSPNRSRLYLPPLRLPRPGRNARNRMMPRRSGC